MATTSRRQFLQAGAAAMAGGEFASRRISAAPAQKAADDRMRNRRHR